jgi:alpha-glucosidase
VPLWNEPFHDGSARYVPNRPTSLDDEFDVRLRVPRAADVSQVVVRQVHDGEPFYVVADVEREDDTAVWFRATLTQHNPTVNYRFLTDAGPSSYEWVTAVGCSDHDPTDAGDFRSSIRPGAPTWVEDAVAYQVFPDRFARSGSTMEASPEWARPASAWDENPIWQGPETPRHFFGGDLLGVEQRLQHLTDLGVNLLYLTPFFPAPSAHRYNASSFRGVDPLLGGDSALISLVRAAHRRGIRVIGDITTNHTGSHHEWFTSAVGDEGAVERGYYYFDDHAASRDDPESNEDPRSSSDPGSSDDPAGYVGWMNVATLPKLNYESAALLERMITSRDSPVRRYLREPFDLDGWRVDVANMTARFGETDRNHQVAHAMRAAVDSEREGAYLVGEHFHDFLGDLDGAGWQGIMNYAGFAKPMWQWLTSGGLPVDNWLGLPRSGWPRLPGTATTATMRAFSGAAWQHRCASMTMVSSHDTPRIRTITGSRGLVEVALAAMMTMPGVPMVWAGDEIGLEGITGEDARRTMPWDQPERWDLKTLQFYRELIALRHRHSCLRTGALRWVFSDQDRIVYLRESDDETILVLLSRGSGPKIPVPLNLLGLTAGSDIEPLYSGVSAAARRDHLDLPGDGPGVAMWRWPTRS